MSPVEYAGIAWGVLGGIGGGAVVVLALSWWLGRVWASRIAASDVAKHQRSLEELKAKYAAELEQLRVKATEQGKVKQATLDRRLHMHRLQFEAEFAAVKETWAHLATVRSAMGVLRPGGGLRATDETLVDVVNRTFPPFVHAKNEFVGSVDRQSPFIPELLLAKYEEVIPVLNAEYFELATSRDDDVGTAAWFASGGRNFQLVVRSCREASEIVRRRLEQLVVID